MGVAEGGVVFQAITKETIDADVGRPDEDVRQRGEMAERNTRGAQRDGPDIRVDQVVAGGTDFRTDQISEHKNVGHQEYCNENRPCVSGVAVEHHASYEDRQSFSPQPAFHLSDDGSVHIRGFIHVGSDLRDVQLIAPAHLLRFRRKRAGRTSIFVEERPLSYAILPCSC
jgi:hypothetical protein